MNKQTKNQKAKTNEDINKQNYNLVPRLSPVRAWERGDKITASKAR
jgi:hypothetical protein